MLSDATLPDNSAELPVFIQATEIAAGEKEFYRVAFGKKLYRSIDELQAGLDGGSKSTMRHGHKAGGGDQPQGIGAADAALLSKLTIAQQNVAFFCPPHLERISDFRLARRSSQNLNI
jgi:hypothetical protein